METTETKYRLHKMQQKRVVEILKSGGKIYVYKDIVYSNQYFPLWLSLWPHTHDTLAFIIKPKIK